MCQIMQPIAFLGTASRGGNCIQSDTLIFCVDNTKPVPLYGVLQISIIDQDRGLKQQLAL